MNPNLKIRILSLQFRKTWFPQIDNFVLFSQCNYKYNYNFIENVKYIFSINIILNLDLILR